MLRYTSYAAALTALGMSATSASAATSAPTDPTYGGRGYVKSEREVSRASVGGLNVHWTADVKTKSPAAALVAADRILLTGTPDGPGLEAMDLQSGKALWAWKGSADDTGAPVRSGDRIIAAEQGVVTSLDRTTGTVAWSHKVDGDDTSVAAAFNRVFVSTDKALTTLKAENGAVRWSQPVDSPARMQVAYGWLFTSQDGVIAAHKPWDGTLRWKHALPRGRTRPSTPYVSKFVAFVTGPDGSGGLRLRAIDSRKGELLWATAVGGKDSCASTCTLATPVADDRLVYAATPDGLLTALDRNTGKVLWTSKLGSAVVGDPVVSAGGVVVVATEKRRLLAISNRTGDALWQQDLDADPTAGPALGRGVVVVRTADGRTRTYALGVAEQRILDWVAIRSPELIDISKDGSVTMTRGSGERRVLSRNVDAKDATVKVDASLTNGQWGYGIFVRSSIDDKGRLSGYSFQYDPGYNFKFIVRHWAGDTEHSIPFAVAAAPSGFNWAGRHTVAVTVRGNTMSATVDGKTVLTVADLAGTIKKTEVYNGLPIPTGGRVGLRAWLSSQVVFHGATVLTGDDH